jgi:gamma-glutamyl:cysteine ligase YbdK (ATP-grasp superfamily)
METTGVSAKTEEYTLGVEEECQIIDPETHGLSPRGEGVLRRARQTLSEETAQGTDST